MSTEPQERGHVPLAWAGDAHAAAVHAGVDLCRLVLADVRGVDPVEAEVDAETRRLVQAVACPWCRAPVGRPCATPRGLPLTGSPGGVHPKRREAAAALGGVSRAHDVASAHGTM